jgi:hypothetical protein
LAGEDGRRSADSDQSVFDLKTWLLGISADLVSTEVALRHHGFDSLQTLPFLTVRIACIA